VAIALFSALSFSASAIPIIQYDINGQAVGVNGVQVGSSVYNVVFQGGSCASVFTGCDDQSDLTFADAPAAVTATKALIDVFVVANDFGPPDFMVHFPASTILGCNDYGECSILTPYAPFDGANLASTIRGEYSISTSFVATEDFIVGDQFDTNGDFNMGLYAWAVWSEQSSSVPEPGTLGILGIGMLGILYARRK
jgi:hypothetical protein